MAMTNAEKVRAFRDRQRKTKAAEQRAPQAHDLAQIFRAPFFIFLERNGNTPDFEQTFDMIGMDPPEFADDSGPKSLNGILEQSSDPDWRLFPENGRSLDRAEVMIGSLLDAAAILAGIVNDFKKREIDARIAELTTADISDSVVRTETIDQIVALRRMKDELDKEIRWPLQQWRVPTD